MSIIPAEEPEKELAKSEEDHDKGDGSGKDDTSDAGKKGNGGADVPASAKDSKSDVGDDGDVGESEEDSGEFPKSIGIWTLIGKRKRI